MSRGTRVNDNGTKFDITVKDSGLAVDISGATVKKIIFRKPSGEKIAKDAVFVTDGKDGKLRYVVAAGDLDAAGSWALQIYLEFPNGKWRSSCPVFQVYKNF